MADNKVNSGLLEFSEDQKVFVALDAETSEVKKAVTIDRDGVETDIAGGDGDVTVEALSVTENGTYSEEGKAYSPVTVNVANDFKKIEIKSVDVENAKITFDAKPSDVNVISYAILTDAQREALTISGTEMAQNILILAPCQYDSESEEYKGACVCFPTDVPDVATYMYSAKNSGSDLEMSNSK